MLYHVTGFTFLRLRNIPLYVYVTFSLSVHVLVDIWVASTFYSVNSAAMNIGVQVSLQDPALNSFG